MAWGDNDLSYSLSWKMNFVSSVNNSQWPKLIMTCICLTVEPVTITDGGVMTCHTASTRKENIILYQSTS